MKKTVTAILALALTFSLSGCSGNSKAIKNIESAQKDLINLTSGKITLTSQMESSKGDNSFTSEFVFKNNEAGNLSYCNTQFDTSKKTIYCEYNDGEKAEQWLVGNGWSVLDAAQYNKDNPHTYLQLLSKKVNKKNIDKVETIAEDTNVRYNLTFDCNKINKTDYKDAEVEVVAQSCSFLIDKDGALVCYNETIEINEIETSATTIYMLEMKISDRNTVADISKPELRETIVKTDKTSTTPKSDK